jgi:hypothetical protein
VNGCEESIQGGPPFIGARGAAVPVGGRPWRRRLERRRGKLGVALGCWGHGEDDAREGAVRGGRGRAGDDQVRAVHARQVGDHGDG